MSESSELTSNQVAVRGAMPAAFGALAGGFSQFASASANRSIANVNRQMSDMQEKDAITRGKEAEQRLRRGVSQTIGEQRASLAAQGISLDAGGTAADLQADTAYLGELDAMTIRNNARREAFGYKMQGISQTGQASINQATQRAAGWSSFLSGAGSTYATYRGLTG
jgi:hypothetical protein